MASRKVAVDIDLLLNQLLNAYVRYAPGSATAGTTPAKYTSGLLTTTAEAGAIEFNGTDWFATRTTVRGTVYISFQRNYSSVALAVNTARLPSSTRDILVVVSFNHAAGINQTTNATIQVDNSGGGVYLVVATSGFTNSLTGLSLGGTTNQNQAISFICPQGSNYKWVTTGAGTTTINSIMELTL